MQPLYRTSQGMELSKAEISGVRTGGISRPKLGEGISGIGGFSCSGIGETFYSDTSPKVRIIWDGSH